MTNLRHILYDISGNLFVFATCHIVFIFALQRNDISLENTFLSACLYNLVFVLYGYSAKLYDVSTFYYRDRIIRIVLAGCILATTAVSTTFYFSGRAQTNRSFYFAYFILSVANHLLAALLSFNQNRKRKGAKHTLLVGKKQNFDQFLDYVKKTNVSFSHTGHVVLFREDADNSPDDTYLGCVEDGGLEYILREQVIDQVYIMREPGRSESVQKCIDICLELGIVTHVVLPMRQKVCDSYVSSMGTFPIISYHMGSLNSCAQAVKRVIDIVGASVGIILGMPFMAAAAVAILLDSPGPVLFSQTRVGKNGRRFKIYKLRTMTTDAEYRKQELLALNEMQGAYMFKIKEDPRITRVGAFLRKTSIDEIPQFFNVFAGSMSLVGTRPPTEDEVLQYERNHWQRLRIKPGITGMWQISGRNQITSFDEIVELDTQYIKNWSILSDIKILLKTLLVVFRKKGAS